MKVLLIGGSTSRNSHTVSNLRFLKNALERKGVEVTLWDLSEKEIPSLLVEFHHNQEKNPHKIVREFVTLIKDSDGIILGTPIYNGSYSGLLKTALDNLPGDAFKNKIVSLVTNAGGIKNTIPLEHLQSVVRTMYGYTTQTQLATSEEDFIDEKVGYRLDNISAKKRGERMIEEMIWLIQSLNKSIISA